MFSIATNTLQNTEYHFESPLSLNILTERDFKWYLNSLKHNLSRFFLIQNHNMAERDVSPLHILIG